MKVLVIGGGGREHALAWKLAGSGHQVLAAPGNAGLARRARCLKISVGNTAALAEAADREGAELVVIGPEAPLVAGLADELRERGLAVFGPGADGARLEGSKSFAKKFFRRHEIPTAEFRVCHGESEARDAVVELGDPLVVKVDGLAAGKGVVVCDDRGQAFEAITELTERLRDASSTLIVERRLAGRELSVMALCDGERIEILAQAEDHKQLLDGDRGPNTGGMGAVSPPEWMSSELIDRVRSEILEPTVAGLKADGIDYRGMLYAGLMVEDDGAPSILEYNCRFGDPETQPVVRRMKGDLARYLAGAAAGKLPSAPLEWDPRPAVCVVVATRGYPQSAEQGVAIRGLDDIEDSDVVVFHAGTARRGSELVTAGGRVLGITAMGDTVEQARERAYAAVERIELDGAQYRRDIGVRRKQ